MFDLILYPLNLAAGTEINDIPGLLVTCAPRKAARMRAQDQLILWLSLRAASGSGAGQDSTAYTPAQQQEMLQRLSEDYYSFSGSVTAGMRSVAARLNEFLLSRNLKASGGGATSGQTFAVLNMAVIHGTSLYAAHAGPTHTFVLSRSQVQHFDDRGGMAGRGLGLARQAIPRFYQAQFEPGDVFVFCPDPPPTWTARALAGSPQLSFEQLRRRLMSDAPVALRAAVIRTQAGKGKITTWKPGNGATGVALAGAGATALAGASATEPGTIPAQPQKRGEPRRGLWPGRARAGTSAATEEAVQDEPAVQDKPAVQGEPAGQDEPAVLPEGFDRSEPARPVEQTFTETQVNRPAPAKESNFTDFSTAAGAASYEIPMVEAPEDAEPGPKTSRSAAPQDEDIPARKAGLGVFLGGLVRRGGKTRAVEPSPRPGRAPRVRAGAAAQPVDETDFSGASVSGALASVPHADGTLENEPAPAPMEAETIHPRAGRRQAPSEPALAKALSGTAQSIRGVWQRGAHSRARISGSMATTARKVMPRRVDGAGRLVPLFNFSAGTMLGIAILIPVLVVAVATAVYFQAGRGEQFQVLFQQAQQYAQQSAQLTDPLQQRMGWTRTLELLDEAETYKRTEESTALRRQAREGLDALEGITRLDYSLAVRSFTPEVTITRMVASLNDVYLLDEGQGRIIRLYRTATGYEVDPQFSCGASEAGALEINPLVDLALPSINNEPRATVVGLDESGNLIYCAPNMDGFESRPLAAPDNGWGRIEAMKIYSGRLYVLDPPSNAVYYYDSQEGVYPDKPHFYFGDSIPKMDDVIDIAIDQEFLYLLHNDGQMTICEGGGYSLAPTSCTDAPYGDPRSGMEPSPLRFDGATFTQLQATQPPDPSLFALDTANQSIFHLSLRRLNLQREYRPRLDTDFPVPSSPPTAFAVAPNRRALVAFGNQVFFAPIP